MKIRRPLYWCAAFGLWVSGAFVLTKMWSYQKLLPDPLGSYIEFTLMFVITFYVLAIFLIRHCLDYFIRRCSFPADADQRV